MVTLVHLLVLTPVRPAEGQTIQGSVRDATSGASIEMADVALLTAGDSIVGRHVTGADGRFVVRAREAGSYRLRATRMGYASYTTDAFALALGQDTVAQIRLLPNPVVLNRIQAGAERRRQRLVQVGFYDRQAKGFGYFRTPEDLEALHPIYHEDLFRGMSGVRIGRGGTVVTTSFHRPCPLSVAVDGQVVERDWTAVVHVNDVEAIEVYPHPTGVPAWLSGAVSPCGAIIIWTKGSLP